MAELLRKQAQDRRLRDGQGIATLSLPEDMFTAMHGGIVFDGGGAVQRFDGTGSSLVDVPKLAADMENEFYGSPRNRAEANKVDLLQQIELLRPEEQAKLLAPGTFGTIPDAFILRRRLQALGYDVDPKTNKIKQLVEQGRRPLTGQERQILNFISKELSATPNEATVRLPSNQKEGLPKPKTGTPSAPSAPGVASLTDGSSFEAEMKKLDPYLNKSVDRSNSAAVTAQIIASYNDIKKALEEGRMTEEEGKRSEENKRAEMAAEYAAFTKDREARREKTRKALVGTPPTFLEQLSGGLAALANSDFKAGDAYKAIALYGAGVNKFNELHRAKLEAAEKFMAEAEELDAKADFAERRGQSKEAEAFRDRAAARKLEVARLNVTMLQAGQGGLNAALAQIQRTETDQGRINSDTLQAATNILGRQIDNQAANARTRFQLANRPPSDLERKLALLENNPNAFKVIFGDKSLVKPHSTTEKINAYKFVNELPFKSPLLNEFFTDELKKSLKLVKTFDELNPAAKQAYFEAQQRLVNKMLQGPRDSSSISGE
jgi:hypothetical protein